MTTLYLAKRLETLRRSQNADGGWAYEAGRQNSWLEPTVYAALALHGEPEADRAWELVRRWQRTDGSWQIAANVPAANWTTALGLLLAAVRGAPGGSAREWLLKAVRGRGWGWKDEPAPAAEPTAWALLALAKAGERGSVVDGARSFLWETPLSAETCGLTLAALRGTDGASGLGAVAGEWHASRVSGAARARLTLGLRLVGSEVADLEDASVPRNLALTALEALAARDGRFAVLRAEA